MSMPKVGMSYQDVNKRCSRILRNPGDTQKKAHLVGSLRNQLRLAEGESALNELDKELCSTRSSGLRSLTGAGTKQIGWGPGRQLGDGHWRFIDGQWKQI